MIHALDHIVILVEDLVAASADYTALGFTVVPGGTHADGATHNALVVFADDTYLELIAFLREAPEHRWWRHVVHGPGLIDFALLPTAIADDVTAARARGLPFGEPVAGGRLRPDGQRVAWQTAQPTTPDLPFLCGDETPRELRVPRGALRHHANGVTGVAAVAVAVADEMASVGRYKALLAAPEAGASFAVGAGAIVLASSDDANAAQRVAMRGEGPCALTFRTTTPAISFDSTRTQGVAMALVCE